MTSAAPNDIDGVLARTMLDNGAANNPSSVWRSAFPALCPTPGANPQNSSAAPSLGSALEPTVPACFRLGWHPCRAGERELNRSGDVTSIQCQSETTAPLVLPGGHRRFARPTVGPFLDQLSLVVDCGHGACVSSNSRRRVGDGKGVLGPVRSPRPRLPQRIRGRAAGRLRGWAGVSAANRRQYPDHALARLHARSHRSILRASPPTKKTVSSWRRSCAFGLARKNDGRSDGQAPASAASAQGRLGMLDRMRELAKHEVDGRLERDPFAGLGVDGKASQSFGRTTDPLRLDKPSGPVFERTRSEIGDIFGKNFRHHPRNEATGPGRIRAIRGKHHVGGAAARRLLPSPVAR